MNRQEKKRKALLRKQLRHVLVHAAGCTRPDCVTHLVASDPETRKEALADKIRIPKSTRKRWATPTT